MLHLQRHTMRWSVIGCLAAASAVRTLIGAQAPAPGAPSRTDEPISISAADCTVEKLGASIPIETIGAPVRRVTLSAPTWTAETANAPAYCRVDGVIDPIDTSATARPINFGVALPARWNRRVRADGRRRHERHRARTHRAADRDHRRCSRVAS